jgi:hypothetical protein
LTGSRFQRINCHTVESDNNSTPEPFSDTDDWLNWNGDLVHLNDGKDDCEADIESDVQQGNGIEDRECPEQPNVRATPNIPGLIWPTRNSKRPADKALVAASAIQTRRNKGVKKQ